MTDKEVVDISTAKAEELKEASKLDRIKLAQADKLVKRRITAKEALEVANSSTKPLSQIYKVIRDMAEDGNIKLEWAIYCMSRVCIKNIVDTLTADGYTVEVSEDQLIIKW